MDLTRGLEFFEQNKDQLCERYIAEHGFVVNFDEVAKLYASEGFDPSNFPCYTEFRQANRLLFSYIFERVVEKEKGSKRKCFFLAGLPGSGKSTQAQTLGNEGAIVYDWSTRNSELLLGHMERALCFGFEVQVHVYLVAPELAFKRALTREATGGHSAHSVEGYLLTADAINMRKKIVKDRFGDAVPVLYFDNTNFEAIPTSFKPLSVDIQALFNIASAHTFKTEQQRNHVLQGAPK
jgi:hypothetical protein